MALEPFEAALEATRVETGLVGLVETWEDAKSGFLAAFVAAIFLVMLFLVLVVELEVC